MQKARPCAGWNRPSAGRPQHRAGYYPGGGWAWNVYALLEHERKYLNLPLRENSSTASSRRGRSKPEPVDRLYRHRRAGAHLRGGSLLVSIFSPEAIHPIVETEQACAACFSRKAICISISGDSACGYVRYVAISRFLTQSTRRGTKD